MKFLFYFLILSLTNLNCNNQNKNKSQKSFNSFDFSYNDVFSTCFSIKFTQSDTVFIRQHFSSAFSSTSKSNTTYYALLSNIDRIKLDSFISHTKFISFDTLYYQSYEDGIDYQFYFEKNLIKKYIRVHSDSVPAQLEKLRIWIVNTKGKLSLHEVDTAISFESLKYFLPPEVPEPLIKFKTPKVE
jgi:hypothetical protein